MIDRYILDGHEPVRCADALEWARWLETADRRVALTSVDGIRVSTVFLGVDHGGGRGQPILFETTAFDDYGEVGVPGLPTFGRYSTWQQAEAGHIATVAIVRGWAGLAGRFVVGPGGRG
jgi:hypothetical protein